MKTNDRNGQVLIEALIAISFLTVGFLAIFSLLARSLALSRSSAESYTAVYLASEGIEVARNMVDGNAIQKKAWNNGFAAGDYEVEYNSVSFLPDQGRFIAYDPSSHLYKYDGLIQTPFKRLIRIKLVGPDEIKINSLVSWIGAGGGDFNINLENHFMNWRI